MSISPPIIHLVTIENWKSLLGFAKTHIIKSSFLAPKSDMEEGTRITHWSNRLPYCHILHLGLAIVTPHGFEASEAHVSKAICKKTKS